jgi:hypothetical protein
MDGKCQGILVIFLGAVAIILAFYGTLFTFHLRRRRRLGARPVLSLAEWSARYGAAGPVTEEVLRALARQVWIQPTQLAPTDRFDVELAFAPLWTGLPNRAVEDFLDNLAEIVWGRGVRGWPRFATAGKTLGDLLSEVNRAVAAAEHPHP